MSFLNLMRNRLKPKAVNDALTKVVQKSPPDFSSAEAGKVLAVDSDGDLEWREETPYIPPSYSSTEEVNTGQKWIDGKDIYCKVLSGTLPEITQSTNYTFETNEGIIFIDGSLVCITSGTLTTLNPYTIRYNATNGAVGSIVTSAFSEADYRIIYRYTKPDPVPSTETKSKKGTKK